MRYQSIVLSATFIVTILFLVFLPVKQINCTVENKPCPPELQEKITVLHGTSFFFTNFAQKILENQLSGHIYILSTIKKIFPNTLELSFQQEAVQYTIIVSGEKKQIGETGIILPTVTENVGSTIEWNAEAQVIAEQKVLPKYHQLFLHIANTIEKSDFKNSKILWNSDQEILLKIEHEPLFIFDTESIQTQLQKVDTIIHARELDEIEKPIIEIDMRFDLPVLRTQQ